MLSYPPRKLWPERVYSLPELSYAETTNACYELLDKNLELGRGPAPAIYFGDSTMTYAQLAENVIHAVGALRQRGVMPGDSVILRLFNRPHFISTFLALLRIGAVAVPTPPLLRSRELAAIVENAEPVLLISESDLWDEVEKLQSKSVPCSIVRALYERPARSQNRLYGGMCSDSKGRSYWFERDASYLHFRSPRPFARGRNRRSGSGV